MHYSAHLAPSPMSGGGPAGNAGYVLMRAHDTVHLRAKVLSSNPGEIVIHSQHPWVKKFVSLCEKYKYDPKGGLVIAWLITRGTD